MRISSYLCDPFLPCNAPQLQVDNLYHMVDYSFSLSFDDTTPFFGGIDWHLSKKKKLFIDSSHYDRGKGISVN